MAGTAATPGWPGMWEASIPAFDDQVRRRPYHRNCGCALHRSRVVPSDAPCPSSCSVSYPIRKRSASWHALSSSSSYTNLAAATSSPDSIPRNSIDGNDIAGAAAVVAFDMD